MTMLRCVRIASDLDPEPVMTEEVDSIKITGMTKDGVHAIRLTLGDKTLTMHPDDALDLSK